jgi:hypothetical protein
MRDLDDLLDPMVSRRASEAAHPPDFAALERRGRQRLRRARATAVGAVVAVVAGVGVVGIQLTSDRSDTAPAGTVEWEGPDGELGRAIESGEAEIQQTWLGSDGSVLTLWTRDLPGDELDFPSMQGMTLAVDGRTRWSPLAHGIAVEPLVDETFLVVMNVAVDVIGEPPEIYLTDADGFRPLETLPTAPTAPTALGGGAHDAYTYALGTPRDAVSDVYGVDIDTATAFPIPELRGASPAWIGVHERLAQTDDGRLWLLTSRAGESAMLRMTLGGQVTRYALPPAFADQSQDAMDILSVGDDGRPILLWEDGRSGLRLSTVRGVRMPVSSVRVGEIGRYETASGATLADGRLLVRVGDRILRSTDATWRAFDELSGLPLSSVRGQDLTSGGGRVCLTSQFSIDVTAPWCTTDGDSWEQADLTP